MERDIMKDLLKWKNKSKRKPLLVRGARQVGKTWIIKEFAKAEFADSIYFVCDKKNETLAGIFADKPALNFCTPYELLVAT